MKKYQKHLILTLLTSTVLSIVPTFAQQSLFEFVFKHTDEIAYFAHPTNSRIKGRSLVEDTGPYVDITIVYIESVTKIRFVKDGDSFSNMYVVSDTDNWPAFLAFGTIKDVAIAMIQEEMMKNPKASKLEQYFLEHVKSWNGRQLAMFCLYLKY